MTWTANGLTLLTIRRFDFTTQIRIGCEAPDVVVQCYNNGHLLAFCEPENGIATFPLGPLDATAALRFLAVGPAEANVNYWTEAFGATIAANRIAVRTPRRMHYGPGDQWRVYLGKCNQSTAEMLAHRQPVHPAGRGACGWGNLWGSGGWGFDGDNAPGWGRCWGIGAHGFDVEMLEWISEALPPGAYPVKVTVVDDSGNESVASEEIVQLQSPPRPARKARIVAFDTDTITITFEPSEDVN